jgi:hypothetical protein
LLSDDPRIASIEAFDTAIHRLREDKFTGFGEIMIITLTEFEKARDDSGLPDDVARYLLDGILEADRVAFQKHGRG